MKFYGNGIVWDLKENKPLTKFNEGVIDTDDPALIEKLLELHYKNNGEFPQVETVNTQTLSDPEPVMIEALKNSQPDSPKVPTKSGSRKGVKK